MCDFSFNCFLRRLWMQFLGFPRWPKVWHRFSTPIAAFTVPHTVLWNVEGLKISEYSKGQPNGSVLVQRDGLESLTGHSLLFWHPVMWSQDCETPYNPQQTNASFTLVCVGHRLLLRLWNTPDAPDAVTTQTCQLHCLKLGSDCEVLQSKASTKQLSHYFTCRWRGTHFTLFLVSLRWCGI